MVKSAIFLPPNDDLDPVLQRILTEGIVGATIQAVRSIAGRLPTAEELLKDPNAGPRLRGYAQDTVDNALGALGGELPPEDAAPQADWDEVTFREPEHRVLRTIRDSPDLTVSLADEAYSGLVAESLEAVHLVERLRETRVLVGFTRVNPEGGIRVSEARKLLRKSKNAGTWLPAYVTHGEGLLLSFPTDRLERWEAGAGPVSRASRLRAAYHAAQLERSLPDRDVTPRFVLLHTLAHLLMNRLTFECGYSSASLRERLYCNEHMASVLIYTAAGDSEGTMGGLVRMGRPGRLEPVLEAALEEARWCSSDPICMESGEFGGQGPDSCNLAACHSCCLVPETACEEYNRFLDRGMLIGSHVEQGIGYFSDRVGS